MNPVSNRGPDGKIPAIPRKQISMVKLLLRLGISQTEVAKACRVSQPQVSLVSMGDAHKATVPFEVWARDVTGGLHRRVDLDWLFDGEDDPNMA